MDIETISNKLKDWFEKHSGEIPENSEDFFVSEFVDSFSIVKLVFFCENEFKIKFESQDFQKKEFKTLEGLVNIISKKV